MITQTSPRSLFANVTKEHDPMKKHCGGSIDNGRRRASVRLLLMLATLGVVSAALTASASAAAPQLTVRTDIPDSVEGGEILYGEGPGFYARIQMENSGTGPMSGTLTVKQKVPAPFELWYSDEGHPCSFSEQTVTCTVDVEGLLPHGIVTVSNGWKLPPNVTTGAVTGTVEVSGGGVADAFEEEHALTIGPPEPFAVESLQARIQDVNAGDEVQAGASPGAAANRFTIPSHAYQYYNYPGPEVSVNAASEHFRNVIVHTPPGITANYAATEARCTAGELNSAVRGTGLSSCPYESQVGIAHVSYISVPVYNMVPPPGVPAAYGFVYLNVPTIISAKVRPSDYGIDLVTRNASTTLTLKDAEVELWGVPADAAHDTARNLCYGKNSEGNTKALEPSGYCPASAPRRAYLRLPTSCNGPLHWKIEMDTYEQPGVYRSRETTTPQQVGCNQLEFTPSFQARPSTNVADSPAGLELKLHLPQNEDPDGLAEAQLKNLTLKLPEGLTVNSAAADGLEACAPEQIGLITPVGQTPAHFNGDQPSCPDASKLGSTVVYTPALDHPVPGALYLASQEQNPFGSFLALYLVLNDPQSGVLVKLPIRAELDPQTGQLTTSVMGSPQLPFEDLTLELDKGPHAALRTPVGCGKFIANSHMTPWTSPEGKEVDSTDSFEIVKGAGGGACVGSETQALFDPKLSTGTLEPKAGAFSPFVFKLTRADGTQSLKGIEVELPEGLLASLGGIPYCSDAALNAVPTGLGAGSQEMAHPSCPAASQLGTVSASVGAGPGPLTVRTGKLYWTGPYKGAPVGLAVVFPAVAGPFDLGNVVTRLGFYVDPETAKITAKSDPLPTMLHGVPIDIRALRADLDRPNYTLNPTSCDPMSFEANLSSSLGVVAHRSEPFQVGGCTTLAFKPKLRLSLDGGTARGKHPALTATLTFRRRGANVARAAVALPDSAFLDQSHIGTICTRVQFAANQCPAQSVYGHARVYSPILGYYLRGPVYLRSSDHKLPDLAIDLRGQVNVTVVGRIDTSKGGGIRTTFESVPDAPVSKFILQMPGGKKGLLQNSTDLCRGVHRAAARFDAQNGKSVELRPELEADCSKASRKHRKHNPR